jgi:hypothetical protein
MLLPHQFGEGFGPPFACQDLITHRPELYQKHPVVLETGNARHDMRLKNS